MTRPDTAARRNALAAVLCAAAPLAVSATALGIGGGLAVVDGKIVVQEKLGQLVARDIAFTDEDGRTVRSGEWFSGQRPVILNLTYFGCPRVCGPVLTGLIAGLSELKMTPGKDYDLVTVSFDARETASLATAKKKSFVDATPTLPLASWHLHTGARAEIDRLCEAVGFGYAWNEHSKDFDHEAVTVFLSPDGKVTRYLFGTGYDKRDLRFAILESAEGKVGTFAERLLVSCYAYDPTTRQYRVLAIAVMQVGGLATLIGLSMLLIAMWKRERRKPINPAPSASDRNLHVREVTP